jgi:hypothetical protein
MNAKLIFCALTVATALASSAVADEARAPRYELKRKSFASISPETRNPFWPIGWAKRRQGDLMITPSMAKFTLDPKLFNVTSIMMGPPPEAHINGRAYREGESLRGRRLSTPTITKLPPLPKIVVYRITDGLVWLACENQYISVPINHETLNEHKGDAELLNEEKDDLVPVAPLGTH